MEEKTTIEGKRYILITDKEEYELKVKDPNTKIYTVRDSVTKKFVKAIPPKDCEHKFNIVVGYPHNIKQCENCILQIPTSEAAIAK